MSQRLVDLHTTWNRLEKSSLGTQTKSNHSNSSNLTVPKEQCKSDPKDLNGLDYDRNTTNGLSIESSKEISNQLNHYVPKEHNPSLRCEPNQEKMKINPRLIDMKSFVKQMDPLTWLFVFEKAVKLFNYSDAEKKEKLLYRPSNEFHSMFAQVAEKYQGEPFETWLYFLRERILHSYTSDEIEKVRTMRWNRDIEPVQFCYTLFAWYKANYKAKSELETVEIILRRHFDRSVISIMKSQGPIGTIDELHFRLTRLNIDNKIRKENNEQRNSPEVEKRSPHQYSRSNQRNDERKNNHPSRRDSKYPRRDNQHKRNWIPRRQYFPKEKGDERPKQSASPAPKEQGTSQPTKRRRFCKSETRNEPDCWKSQRERAETPEISNANSFGNYEKIENIPDKVFRSIEHPYLIVHVKDQNFDHKTTEWAILDTGANCTLVSHRLAKLTNSRVFPSLAISSGLGGGIEIVGQIYMKIRKETERESYLIRCLVTAFDFPDHILVGTDVQKILGIGAIPINGRFRFWLVGEKQLRERCHLFMRSCSADELELILDPNWS